MATARKAKDARATYLIELDRESDILSQAEAILQGRLMRLASIGSPRDTIEFLRVRLAGLQAERFDIVLLDNRHRVIAVEALFNGTIDGASTGKSRQKSSERWNAYRFASSITSSSAQASAYQWPSAD